MLTMNDDQTTLLYSWSIEDIYVYVGADCRCVTPFDMHDYRVCTILSTNHQEQTTGEYSFGVAFRFLDRQQMFSWYIELIRHNGHDKWTRAISTTSFDNNHYFPSSIYHTSSSESTQKKSDLFKKKFLAKSCHVASNLYKQLRK
jgi:hypothetical protein